PRPVILRRRGAGQSGGVDAVFSVLLMLDRLDNRLAIEAAESGAVQSLVKAIDGGVLAETASYAVKLSCSRSTARQRCARNGVLNPPHFTRAPTPHKYP